MDVDVARLDMVVTVIGWVRPCAACAIAIARDGATGTGGPMVVIRGAVGWAFAAGVAVADDRGTGAVVGVTRRRGRRSPPASRHHQ